MTERPTHSPTKRIIFLDRRVAFIEPDRINVRPALAAALLPLFGLLLGVAVVSIPLAGIGFVYAVAGANVVFDRKKQSGVWQQGFLGMGVGTTELVPFWKIEEIRIEETTRERQRGDVQDLAQFEIVLVKTSGKHLKVGDMVVARSMIRQGLQDVREVAEAIAQMTEKPLIAPEIVRRRRVEADGAALADEASTADEPARADAP